MQWFLLVTLHPSLQFIDTQNFYEWFLWENMRRLGFLIKMASIATKEKITRGHYLRR